MGVVLRGLVKDYRSRDGTVLRAVDHLDLDAHPGEVLAFLGPNGAGKTTTIKMCCGLIHPNAGTMRVAGYDPVTRRGRVLRHLGAVLEGNRNVYWDLTCAENLRYFGRIKLVPDPVLRRRIPELLGYFGLEDKAGVLGKDLSRGMQQKLAIACALIHDPRVLLLDEPTLGLDVQAARAVKERVRQMAAEQGRTVVLTTHQLDVAQELAHRVAIISRGRLVAVDRVESLLDLFRREEYRFRVAGELPPPLAAELGRLGHLEVGNGEFRILFQGQADLHGVADLVRRHGLRLLAAVPAEPDLEQAFLALTEGQGRPAAGQGVAAGA